MYEIISFIIGIAILVLGIPLGNFLAKVTKEELQSGRKWFRLIILHCCCYEQKFVSASQKFKNGVN